MLRLVAMGNLLNLQTLCSIIVLLLVLVGSQGNSTQSAARRNHSVNANHLLNFYYDPISRPQQPSRSPPTRRQRKIKPYNKDLFLQANFKFVVLDNGSYLSETMDPDKMLQWEDVICVRYSSSFPVQCPICLEAPLCPQITSCGHIYCFPCILRYLLMGEEDHKGECWKKCPLCFMSISCKDLYTLRVENVNQFHVGDHVDFTLLTRAKDSLVPSIKNQQGAGLTSDNCDSSDGTFSKFILTSDVELSVMEAKMELSNWLEKAESGLVDDLEKLPYVCGALEQLEERLKNLMEHQKLSASPPKRNHSSAAAHVKVAHLPNSRSQVPSPTSIIKANNASLESWELDDGTRQTNGKRDISESSEKHGLEDSGPLSVGLATEKDSYTFYQAIDGQHLILHPLNMKCLLHHYGSYGMLPPRISGVILELETVTQSEAMRRRYRYLSHFSLTTTFQLCEIDLRESLPPESLAPFVEEIKKRGKQRKRLARKEEVEKVKAEAAALSAIPVPSNRGHSSINDAIFSLDDFEALGSGMPSTSPPIIEGRKLFSNVARLGFAAAHDSPSLKYEGLLDSTGNIEDTGETSRIQDQRNTNTNTLSFAHVISASRTVDSPEPQKTVGFGKKGKKPTKVLLSTAGGRRY
ncbi:putative E3 ubiquitin ligase protein [Dioscorea alata]|uniref:E3 ubiquitin ligase protein n=1 Tax=Dioscorea alata TaxID=55571 RepID=A0ACB7UTP7_DIOAL|nr:putative E3 ubiquitin ligase protein [Dioscorea alata]